MRTGKSYGWRIRREGAKRKDFAAKLRGWVSLRGFYNLYIIPMTIICGNEVCTCKSFTGLWH